MIRLEYCKTRYSAERVRSGIGAARLMAWSRTSLVLFIFFLSIALGSVVPARAASFTERAQEYISEGDLRAASVELKNALQRDPNDPEARFLLGKVYLRLGDGRAAEKELLRARELGHESQDLELMLAYARLNQGRLDEVARSISEGIPIETEIQRDLYIARGEALLGLGQLDEAQAIFDRVLRDGPHTRALVGKARIATILGDQNAAREMLDKAAAIAPDDPLVTAVDAQWLLRAGRYEEAMARFERAIELDPTRLENYLGKVQTHLALGELDAADQILRRLQKEQPDNLIVTLQDSIVQFRRGNYQTAKTLAERVLSVDANQPQALLIAGQSAYQLKEYEQSRRRLLAYLAQDPGNNQARMTLGAAMVQLGYSKEAYETLSLPEGELPDSAAYLNILSSTAFDAGDQEAGARYLEQLAAKTPNDAEVQEKLGVARMSLGDMTGGIAALERAIELEPGRFNGYVRLYAAHLRNNAPEQALEVARQLKIHVPDKEAAADNFMGLAHLAIGDAGLAREAFQRALAGEPDNVEVAGNLANILRIEGKLDEARTVFDQALAAKPDHQQTLLAYADMEASAGNDDKADELLQQAVQSNPEEIKPRVVLGNRYIEQGRPAAALALAEPALAKHPQMPALLETVGQSRLLTGDYNGALEAFETLVQLAPNDPRGLEYLMIAQGKLRRGKEALETAERVLAIDPDSAIARFGRVEHLAGVGRLEEAKAELEVLKADFPDAVDLLQLEGRIAVVERRNEDALAAFRRVFELRPNNFTLIDLVRILFVSGNGDEGLAMLRDWLDAHPQDLLSHMTLGQTYLALNRLEDAKAQYRTILSIAPNNAGALNNLAWVLTELGEESEALPLARRASELSPDNPLITDNLAVALLKTGNKEEALELLRNALQSTSGNTRLRFHFAQALVANGHTEQAIAELRALLNQEESFGTREQAEKLLAELTQ